MSKDLKGFILATISGASFGLIPLFTIPVIEGGMGYASLIFYRFLFGSIFMAAFLLWRRTPLGITLSEALRISLLSFNYIICAITLFMSYDYITSGVATSLIYTNPLWCALICIIFFKERLTAKVCISMFLAILGVMLLSGFFDASSVFSPLGMTLGLWSGIGYGVYLVMLPRMALSRLSSLKLTFYIFFLAMLMLLAYAIVFEGGIEPIHDTPTLVNLILVGLLPTAFSNICVTMALRLIDTSIVSILGAFEPFTAMVVGVLLLNEPCTFGTITGGTLVLASVILLTLKKPSST